MKIDTIIVRRSDTQPPYRRLTRRTNGKYRRPHLRPQPQRFKAHTKLEHHSKPLIGRKPPLAPLLSTYVRISPRKHSIFVQQLLEAACTLEQQKKGAARESSMYDWFDFTGKRTPTPFEQWAGNIQNTSSTQKGLSRSPVTSSWERRLHGSMLYHQPPAQCLSKYRPKAEKTPKKDANPELVQTPCTCRILTPTCCACFRSLSRPDPPHTNFVNGQRRKRYMPSLCSPPEVMGERHASFEGRK